MRKTKAAVMRKTLPYGRYILPDGTFVFFNRDYEPIEKISPDGRRELCDLSWWVPNARKEFFFGDHNPPWSNRKTLEKVRRIVAEGGPRAQDVWYKVDLLTEDERPGCYPYPLPWALQAK